MESKLIALTKKGEDALRILAQCKIPIHLRPTTTKQVTCEKPFTLKINSKTIKSKVQELIPKANLISLHQEKWMEQLNISEKDFKVII